MCFGCAMKLYSAPNAFYITNRGFVLKCCKASGRLTAYEESEVSDELKVALDIGDVSGVVGSLRAANERYLLLITQCTPVATFPCTQAEIHHVDRVLAVQLEDNTTIDKIELSVAKTHLGKIRSSQRKLLKFVSDKVSSSSRTIDEILRLFNESGDFYVCFGSDLTLTAQRLLSTKDGPDDRFFWNRHLLDDLFMDNGFLVKNAYPWIAPICQGFVCERTVAFETDCVLTLTLISRRSVKRAGVRYLRRGIDDEADVANFVETELILSVFGHYLAYVQIRGSVPVFWSQHGYRYRPPLIIDKPVDESLPVFKKHINSMLQQYGAPLTIVNLVDQTGRELNLALSYLQHILQMNSPDLAYFSFDFHSHCRALRFHKVNDLVSALAEHLSKIQFCWVDKSGQMVREQHGIIRTNCVDCLDRTNIVQCAISQAMCLIQAQKLGLVGPFGESPDQLVRTLQSMWADNGDAISRQYAGTDALKGDVTRSGQRKIVGMVRDGYTSASRYYLSHMRDNQRQLAIDALLNGSITKSNLRNEDNECEADEEESESIGRLVSETVHFILPEQEVLVGGWALVDGSHLSDQIDTVLLLTRQRVIVAMYDDDSEKLLQVKIIGFEDITCLQLGTFYKSPRIHLRLCAKPNEQFSWHAAKTRLFNNVAIPLKTPDEADEYMEAIGEQLRVTMEMAGYHVELSSVGKLSGCPDGSERRFANIFTSVFGTRDDSAHISDALPKVPQMHTSKSDGRLAEKAGAFILKLPKLRLPISKSHLAIDADCESFFTPETDPFSQFRQKILTSKSRIMLL